VTAVTANEAGSKACYLDGRYGSTPSPLWVSCSCRSGQALVSNPPDETGLPASCSGASFRCRIPVNHPPSF
jgi:hypothetical protein